MSKGVWLIDLSFASWKIQIGEKIISGKTFCGVMFSFILKHLQRKKYLELLSWHMFEVGRTRNFFEALKLEEPEVSSMHSINKGRKPSEI